MKKRLFVSFLLLFLPVLVLNAATNPPANRYNWTNLFSDLPGVALRTDTNLVNPWGIAPSPNGNIWVNDNGTGLSTVYKQDGTNAGLVVNTLTASPTGLVFNGTSSFPITEGANTQPSLFIFVSEDGIITGWNPTVDATNAVVAVDNSGSGAIYKGAALSGTTLYVTNFHANKVEMYDGSFNRIDNGSTFVDATLPARYAPFGIATINGQIFVSYAKQDADAEDDVSGAGNGFVDIYNTNGTFVKRLISHGNLNSPWGLAAGPTQFGHYSGGLYVGNFGDGIINVYNSSTGAFQGTLSDQVTSLPLQFDGLWGMLFLGNNLWFTAGIGDESHGLFGSIFPTK